MILNRIGSKKKIFSKIEKYFPQHNTYIEPFFGAGGMFFNKKMAKHNLVNDIDSEVFNLFNVVLRQKKELYDILKKMPIHSDLLNHWVKHEEKDKVIKAARFILLSNFTLYGKQDTLKCDIYSSQKKNILSNIEKTFDKLQNVIFMNKDFRKFIKSICLNDQTGLNKSFIYCDPPYLNTTHEAYNMVDKWGEKDFIDLLDSLTYTKCKFCISEFNNEFILNECKSRGLNVILVCDRINIKNRKTEILITNYKQQSDLFTQ